MINLYIWNIMKLSEILWVVSFAFVSLVMTSCEKEELLEDDIVKENVSSVSKPTIDKYLVTTTLYDVNLGVRFINGGDSWEKMKCKVHWRKYSSKPTQTPKKSDMNKHESMRIIATTKSKTTFMKEHSGFSGGNYIYYYFECENSKYSAETDVKYCIVKR